MKTYNWLIISLLVFCIGVLVINCSNPDAGQMDEGRQLAETHCRTCHQFAPPELLDSITWVDKVLPAMAPKLGIGVWSKTQYFPPRDTANATISFEDWNKIVGYYKSEAPQLLSPAHPSAEIIEDMAVFRLVLPEKQDKMQKTMTSLVKIDTRVGDIYSGDAATGKMIRWDQQLTVEKHWRLPSPPVSLFFDESGMGITTCIGTLSGLNLNLQNGQVISFQTKTEGDTAIMFSGLSRPVQTVPIDVDKDGLVDWLIAGFGHDVGGLILLHQTDKGIYNEEMVYDMPGAEQIIVGDFNNDGWQDMMVLFAQAREGIWLFTNNKQGGFDNRNILEFPPVYGSTSFQISDFNGDGKPDILYTCGDNADYSAIFKPYHGVYIFMNKGDFTFEQSYFYPINGCTKAMAADFDGDGDADIVTIAYFADPDKSPAESFIYFEQNTPLEFIPHSLPVSQYGRWISMDVGDVNADGRPDIVLGNFSDGFGKAKKFSSEKTSDYPIILLENLSN